MNIIHKQYQISKVLGKGSFGIVCEGINLKSKKKVAIKLEKIDAFSLIKHETTVLRFLHNSKIPGIPEIHYYGIEDSYRCLVMTYYETSLDKWIPMMTASDILDWWNQSIVILEYIHKTGFLHRDLKPGHFMRQKLQNKVVWNLIDFGIAAAFLDDTFCHIEEPEIRTTIIGSPHWISHHIHIGKEPSRRDDYISLWFIYLDTCLRKQNDSLSWTKKTLDWSSSETLQISHPNHTRMYQLKSETNIRKQIEDSHLPEKDKCLFLKTLHRIYCLSFQEKPPYETFGLYEAFGNEFMTRTISC